MVKVVAVHLEVFHLFTSNLLFNLGNLRDTSDEVQNSDDEMSDDEVLVGDMVLSDDQMRFLYTDGNNKRLGLASPITRWPNATVYYEWDNALNESGKKIFTEAMNYIQNVSCVRFKVKDEPSQHFVLIKPGKACSSKVGMRRGRPQHIMFDGDTCSKGSLIHEILHSLGFLHMHTANNRDEYIKINWENIRDDAKVNFKQFVAHVSMFETEYDYDSITHYSDVAFAKDKSIPTITAKNPAPRMGQRKGTSERDESYLCNHKT